MPTIRLPSSDNEVFVVNIEVTKISSMIKTMIDDLGVDDDYPEVVRLPVVSAATLRK